MPKGMTLADGTVGAKALGRAWAGSLQGWGRGTEAREGATEAWPRQFRLRTLGFIPSVSRKLWRIASGKHGTHPLSSPGQDGFSEAQNSLCAPVPVPARPSLALTPTLSYSCMSHLQGAASCCNGWIGTWQ